MAYIISSGESSDGIILENDFLTVCKGGIATRTSVNENGMVHIYGTADNTEVNQSGTVFVDPDGVASNTILNSGGSMYVHSAGVASVATVNAAGILYVSSGGTANQAIVNAAGNLDVFSGGLVNDTTVNADGELYLHVSGRGNAAIVNSDGRLDIHGIMDNTTVNSGGEVWISSAGTANNITVNGFGILIVRSGGMANLAVVNSNALINIYNGGMADNTTVNFNGILNVSSGGTANNTVVNANGDLDVRKNGVANNTTVNADGIFYIYRGGAANNTVVNSDGQFETLGTVNGITVYSGGFVCISSGGRFTGTMTFESGAFVSACKGATLDFDLTQTSAGAAALVNDISILQGTLLYTLTVSDSMGKGVYSLADGADGFQNTISVVNASGEALGSLTVGDTIQIGDEDFTLNLTGSALTLEVKGTEIIPTNLVGTKDRVSWDPTGAGQYVVEYSTDDFQYAIQILTTGTAVDMLDLPAGKYQWRVKAGDSEWAVGDEIVSDNTSGTPKVIQSEENGDEDLFFADSNGTWGEEGFVFLALHAGSLNSWTGTHEIVIADGKGRIQNLFFGSSDPNVLCLTDADNGDAIFVDDIYTELPEEIEENTARLFKIREIRAGAGDDIVDMTSQRFEYTGDGLTIRGGEGNDTIWANKGDNWLFGDAGNDRIVGASSCDVIAGGIGNDRMHGGGGKDTFTFCENWGVDNVEQLETGSVTLWFASGSLTNWDEATLTYTDGENSVKVSGVTLDKITLKFGDDGSEDYAALASAGAFLDATSERIFEESGKGMLASL